MDSIKKLTEAESSHPAKAIFVRNHIPLRVVAEYIQRDYFYTSRILSGIVKPGPQVEQKLLILARLVEEKGVENA